MSITFEILAYILIQSIHNILYRPKYFPQLEAVVRVTETQLEVGENIY